MVRLACVRAYLAGPVVVDLVVELDLVRLVHFQSLYLGIGWLVHGQSKAVVVAKVQNVDLEMVLLAVQVHVEDVLFLLHTCFCENLKYICYSNGDALLSHLVMGVL